MLIYRGAKMEVEIASKHPDENHVKVKIGSSTGVLSRDNVLGNKPKDRAKRFDQICRRTFRDKLQVELTFVLGTGEHAKIFVREVNSRSTESAEHSAAR